MMMKKNNGLTGGLFQIFGCCLIVAAFVFSAAAQTVQPIEVFDGRDASESAPLTPAEQQLISKEVRQKEALIRETTSQNCEEDELFSFAVIGGVNGSFTKPKVRQKAYLYELCRSTLVFGIGGIVIVEDGKIAAHYIYGENGLDTDLAVLPDINRNGISEILLIGGGTSQGYTHRAVEIIEFTGRGIKTFGTADVYEDNFGTEGKPRSARAYKVSVQAGKTPVFFRETFTRKKQEGKWLPAERSRRYSPRKDYEPRYHKIS